MRLLVILAGCYAAYIGPAELKRQVAHYTEVQAVADTGSINLLKAM
jgi:hypothetical protein